MADTENQLSIWPQQPTYYWQLSDSDWDSTAPDNDETTNNSYHGSDSSSVPELL
jgi:hypothetical protein